MGHTKRTYEIIEAVIGGPPTTRPVLGENGNVLPPDKLLIFNKSTNNMRKVDHYRIRFEIKQFNQSPLRFTPNLADVLWVKKGTTSSSCPTSACHEMPDTFWVDEMDSDGKWIDVINMDLKSEEFWFTLNLVDKNNPTGMNYVPVDPGGGNQNSGLPGSGTKFDFLAAIALGAVAGILAFAGAQLFLPG